MVEGSFWPATSGTLNEKGKKIGVVARVAHGGRNPFLPMKTLCAVLLLAGAVGRAAEIPTPNFRAVDIDTKIEIGYGLAVADVDGDGKPDVLLADKKSVVWYRNPTWEKFTIAENLTEKDNVCIAAADIDGDGKCEVAVGAEWNPGDTVNSGAVFFLIAPADRTQRWEPVRLPHEPTVHRMQWVKNRAGAFELLVQPLHGRGNKNSVGAGARLLAYTVPADRRGEWKTTVVGDFMHASHNLQSINWDRDPEEEIIAAGKEGVWFFGASTGEWRRRQFTDQPAGEIRDGKLPGGRRFITTIEPMHGLAVAVYLEPEQAGGLWARQALDETLKDGHALAVGDVLGTGSPQIVAGWRAMNPRGAPGIRLYAPGDAAGTAWQTFEISGPEVAVEDLKLADLNGDGRLDIIAAGRQTKNVRIFFNLGTK